MIRLTTLLTESSLKPYEKLIIDSVVSFMTDKFSINAKITIKRKNNNKFIGDVSLNDNSVKLNKFTLHWNPNQSYSSIIQSLIHELTHVKQISKKELQPAKDYKSLYWKGKKFISVRDYNKLMKKDARGYMKLPWEMEAETNMSNLYKVFLKSKYWKELRGKNTTLDYIMDNI